MQEETAIMEIIKHLRNQANSNFVIKTDFMVKFIIIMLKVTIPEYLHKVSKNDQASGVNMIVSCLNDEGLKLTNEELLNLVISSLSDDDTISQLEGCIAIFKHNRFTESIDVTIKDFENCMQTYKR